MGTPELIISIITAVAAILALIISIISVRQSNRQSMFERRLAAFLKIKWMYYLIKPNNEVVKSYINDMEEGPLFNTDFLYQMMTNNTYLEEIQPVISHPLESEWQRKYLMKIEDMRSLCEEIRLYFLILFLTICRILFFIILKC